jgi:hypothetical protein
LEVDPFSILRQWTTKHYLFIILQAQISCVSIFLI